MRYRPEDFTHSNPAESAMSRCLCALCNPRPPSRMIAYHVKREAERPFRERMEHDA